MLDRTVAPLRDRLLAADPGARREQGGRRRAFVACALLAIALHLAFLDGVGDGRAAPREPATAPLSVRTIAPDRAPDVAAPAVAEAVVPAAAPPPAPAKPRPRPREPQSSAGASAPSDTTEASASSPALRHADSLATDTRSPPPSANGAAADSAATAASAADRASSVPLATLAGAADPPPVYRTVLPPAATLHYQVRRGGLRGEGEIRWQPAGDSYRLVLVARIAGLTLLVQTSEGGIDGHGLAPTRFVDQRARRPAQAANFVRDAGRITFSGSALEAPLLAGSQDRLGWMIQLAAIAAAEPERLVDGGQISMAVVGARGDASVWVLRYAGHDDVATAHGPVRAVKLVRQGGSPYDTTAEIWLDPERSYLPARATLRSNGGVSEYELLLERIDPVP